MWLGYHSQMLGPTSLIECPYSMHNAYIYIYVYTVCNVCTTAYQYLICIMQTVCTIAYVCLSQMYAINC